MQVRNKEQIVGRYSELLASSEIELNVVLRAHKAISLIHRSNIRVP